MPPVHDVAEIRAAEEELMAGLPEGALMQRAATGLAIACANLLGDVAGSVSGSLVTCLVGSGNNGGDTMWAGVRLVERGARVRVIALSDRLHVEAATALRSVGGTIRRAGDVDLDTRDLSEADLILDGIVGIGGTGALRPEAARLARTAEGVGVPIVAVDVPSGVSADTGEIADAEAVVTADLTVTFGCLKPGLLLWPGREHAGGVAVVDIGLDQTLPDARTRVLSDDDLAATVPEPAGADYKYSRGVVGVAAGSARYRGAGFLATGAARCGDAGMVQFLDRGDGLADAVIDRFWDVVAVSEVRQSRATAWAIGPGLGEGEADRHLVDDLLGHLPPASPLVLDADALRLLADPNSSTRLALASRGATGGLTVVTPHVGEFRGMGFPDPSDRLAATRAAAEDLGCVVLLKGPGTVVASPTGLAFIDVRGTAVLGTAGSGDLLTGLTGALLAGASARSSLTLDDVARISAAASSIHAIAGDLASRGGIPATARDILAALPLAVARVRRGTLVEEAR